MAPVETRVVHDSGETQRPAAEASVLTVSGVAVDRKQFEPAAPHLIDSYIQAGESEKISELLDGLIAQRRQAGAVTVIQRANSDLRLNPRLHSIFLDGPG